MVLTSPRSCHIQMAILDIVMAADETTLVELSVPYVGGGSREGFGGSLAELSRPCLRTWCLATEIYGH